MTAPIITPALVRRYLLASGWTVEQIGDRLAWTRPDGSACWSSLDAVPVMFSAAPPLRADEYGARLGMLAAAEMALQNAAQYPADVFHPLGSSVDCISARMAVHTSRALANQYIKAAGLTPEAWEEAKGR